MKTRWTEFCAAAAVLLAAGVGLAQPGDVLGVARLQQHRSYRATSNHTDPSSNDDSKRLIPGETVVLADLAGPGVVKHIWITVAANEYGWPRLVRLRIYYDGSTIASVDAPLGDFFGAGHGLERSLSSAMIRNSSTGRSRNSYWPMPFRKACKITVTNEGRQRVHALYYHVDWHKVAALPEDAGYFHARYRQTIPAEGKPLDILSVRGRGQFAGLVFSVIQAESGWFGEGDERIYVDGGPTPVIEGTGTEDYFNDAWSLRVAEGPYTGVPVADGTSGAGSRMTAYRWHVEDPIPFSRSFRFDIEHAGWTYHPDGRVRSGFQERFDLFSWVSYWYQQGVAEDQPEAPYGAARLPHGNARQIEAESLVGNVTAERGRVDVGKEVFWSRDVLQLHAEGAGSKFDIPFEVGQDGRYELVAQMAQAPDCGIYEVMLDGKPVNPEVSLEHEPGANLGAGTRIDGYFSEIYVAQDHLLAWRALSRGRHVLTLRCVGKNPASSGYNTGVDTLILARIGELRGEADSRADALRRAAEQGRASAAGLRQGLADGDPAVRVAAAWGFTQAPAHASASVPALRAGLADSDPVVRGLAAVSLRNCGLCAEPALPALIAGLQDPDENVRIASADAIAKLGAKAAPAVPGLIELAEAPNQHPHVLRSVAYALSAIGPAAASAVPVLERLSRHIRVRWIARTAIARITNQPPPAGPEPSPR